MATGDGSYVSMATLKRALHITGTGYDEDVKKCIAGVEGKINTILQEHTTTPITQDDDIEQITLMKCTSRFEMLYRENLTEDLFARMREMGKTADDDLMVYIKHNYTGRSMYAQPEVRRVTPSNNTNILTDLY